MGQRGQDGRPGSVIWRIVGEDGTVYEEASDRFNAAVTSYSVYLHLD